MLRVTGSLQIGESGASESHLCVNYCKGPKKALQGTGASSRPEGQRGVHLCLTRVNLCGGACLHWLFFMNKRGEIPMKQKGNNQCKT